MTQEYVTVTQVMAWPAEQDGQPGYNVKAPSGTIAWQAKETFESAHVAMGHTGHLAQYQRRVVAEKALNDDRVTKLTAFLATDAFKALRNQEKATMEIQLGAMSLYSNVLAERIDDFATS